MSKPSELQRPGIWLSRSGKARVLLPFNSDDRAANPRWLKSELGDRVQVKGGPYGTWEIARGQADAARVAMRLRFGKGETVLVTDSGQQMKCGPRCQKGKPENALMCACQCGGENHGGVSDDWVVRDSFLVRTDVVRRVFWV